MGGGDDADKRTAEGSEREHGRVLPSSKHVHECLAHEEPNSDTNGNGYHCTPNVDPIAGRGDRPSVGLRETRLEKKSVSSTQNTTKSTQHVPGPRRVLLSP